MPVRLRIDSERAACTGRSMPSLVPLPAMASGSFACAAATTAAATAASSVGASASLNGLCQREHLVRVQQPPRVERLLDAALLRELVRAELHRHQLALFHADAVLAGQAAAHLDAQRQDVGAELLRLAETLR